MSNLWSKGSGKMEGIPSLNSNTRTNPFCQSMYNSGREDIICTHCYSMTMLSTFRKNCEPKFEMVGTLLSSVKYKHEELLKLGTLSNSLVNRIHSHGELINTKHLHNIISICENQPRLTFSLWTKRKDFVSYVLSRRAKPENFILIYSNPHLDKIMDRVPKHFDKVFNNITRSSDQENCFGKCIECMMCYTPGESTSQIVEKVK